MGKKILISGATDGLGLAATYAFAALGHQLILLGRNKSKLADLKATLISNYSVEVECYVVDLSLLKETCATANKITAQHTFIDVLINNAGGVFSTYQVTTEGLEKTIALNHFSYFVLSNTLLPLLLNAKQGRIINVSSNSHYGGTIDFDSFTHNKSYNLLRAYNQSKLANLLLTTHLANSLKNTTVTVNALSPQRVATNAGFKQTAWWTKVIWKLLILYKSVPIEKAIATYTFLALDETIKNTSGKYFENAKEKIPSLLSTNEDLGNQLWNYSLSKLAACNAH
jgi:NAD(P)-dependent dehydrogenase (short-subunit alcohol dehydrogenase family)